MAKLSLFSYIQTALNHILPPLCIHCGSITKKRFLCASCLQEVEIGDQEALCGYCSKPFSTTCSSLNCSSKAPFYVSTVFANMPPIHTINRLLYKGGSPHLAKLIACYVVVKVHELNWGNLFCVLSKRGSPFHLSPYRELEKEVAKLLSLPLITKLDESLLHKRVLLLNPQLIEESLQKGVRPCLLELA